MTTLSTRGSIDVYHSGDDPDIPPLVENPYPFTASDAPITVNPCKFDDDMPPLIENPYPFHFISPGLSSEPSHSCSFDDEIPPLVEPPAPFFDTTDGRDVSSPMANAVYSFYPTQNRFSSPNFLQASIQSPMFIYPPSEQYMGSLNCFEKKLNFDLPSSSLPPTSYDPLASSSTISYEKEPNTPCLENKQATASSSITLASSSSSAEDSHPVVFESYQFDFPLPPPAGPTDESPVPSSSSQPAHEQASVPAPRISHSKKRDASYIPRPPNAFILFRSAFVKGDYVGAEVEGNHSALSKIVGKYWKTLSREEKETWEAKAQLAQAEHRRRYPDWRFQPSTNALANANTSTGGSKRSASSKWKKDKLKKEDGKKDRHTKGKGRGNNLDGGDEEEHEKRKIREESNTSVGAEDSSALDARCAKIADLLVEGKTGHELELALREWEVNQAHVKLGNATDRHQDIGDSSVLTTSSLSPGPRSDLDASSPHAHTGPVRRNRTQRRTHHHNAPYSASLARVPAIQRSERTMSPSILVSSSPILDKSVPLTSMFRRPSSPLYVTSSAVVETKLTGDVGETGGSGAGSGHSGLQNYSFSDSADHVTLPAQKFERTNIPQSLSRVNYSLRPSPTANNATLLLDHGSFNSGGVNLSESNFYAASTWNGGHYSTYAYDQRPLSDSY